MSDDTATHVTSKKRPIEQLINHDSDRKQNEQQQQQNLPSNPDDSNQSNNNDNYHDNLFTLRSTLDCAIDEKCVTCAYKIGCFDVALDKEFTRLVPNKRPETCPRYHQSRSSSSHHSSDDGAGGSNGEAAGAQHMYKRGMNILTVGDGDFGFSLSLARMLYEKGDGGDSSSGRLVTTSYESYETLCDIYPDISSTIDELEELGAKIMYEVDGTRLERSLDGNSSTSDKFHRIAWNFPCKAAARGRDGQNDAMEENKTLVKRFLASAAAFLMPSGEIHVAHKTKPPFNHWKLEDLRVKNIKFKGRLTFDVCCFPGYRPRKALDKKSFTCHDARIFVFRSKTKKKRDGTKKEGGDGRSTYSIPKSDGDDSSEAVVRVTKKLVSTIRSTHMSCASRKQSFIECNYRRDTKKKGRYK